MPKAPSQISVVVTATFRIVFLTLLFAALGMGLGLFVGIISTVIYGAVSHTHPDMAMAYRYVAVPIALLSAACAFLFNLVSAIRRAVRHA